MRASCANSAWPPTSRPSRSNSLPAFKQLPDAVEDGATFEENAIKKALHYGPHVAGPLFADDSGLEVEALGGAPGVYSARYSGAGCHRRIQQSPAAGESARRGQSCGALRVRDRAGRGSTRDRRLSRRGGRRDHATSRAALEASATTRCSTVPAFGCTFGEATRGTEVCAEPPRTAPCGPCWRSLQARL